MPHQLPSASLPENILQLYEELEDARQPKPSQQWPGTAWEMQVQFLETLFTHAPTPQPPGMPPPQVQPFGPIVVDLATLQGLGHIYHNAGGRYEHGHQVLDIWGTATGLPLRTLGRIHDKKWTVGTEANGSEGTGTWSPWYENSDAPHSWSLERASQAGDYTYVGPPRLVGTPYGGSPRTPPAHCPWFSQSA